MDYIKRLIVRFSMWRLSRKRYGAIGDNVYVWFRKSHNLIKMEVSSFGYGRFTARFKNDEDWARSNVEIDYGQTDNDITVSSADGQPVDYTKK